MESFDTVTDQHGTSYVLIDGDARSPLSIELPERGAVDLLERAEDIVALEKVHGAALGELALEQLRDEMDDAG